MDDQLKFAVLIDADNISDKYIKIIFDETAGLGVATYKRIYGDWTSRRLSSWKTVLLDNSIIPIQQYSYTSRKNSTDAAMTIDAMDILYSSNVSGFCIVSSDSDFTRLAARLRESGMQVIGMGESKTPRPFIAACNQFKYLDILYAKSEKKITVPSLPEQVPQTNGTAREQAPSKEDLQPQNDLKTITDAIVSIIEDGSDDDGWIFSAILGNRLAIRYPDFDVRNFGYSKLMPFIESLGKFNIKRVPAQNDSNVTHVYIRNKH